MEDTPVNKSNSLQVEILFSKFLKPSSPTPDHLRIFKLSFLDQIASPIHGPILWFYATDESVDAAETSRRLEKLEKSLSEILSRYYPLAGRLSSDLLSVDCQDQGVAFRMAKSNLKICELIKLGKENVELLNCLALEPEIHDLITAPLDRVRITIFGCGGLVVALEILYKITDGFSATKFSAE